jgi:hypothetical protein
MVDIAGFCHVVAGQVKLFFIGVIFLEQWVGMI